MRKNGEKGTSVAPITFILAKHIDSTVCKKWAFSERPPHDFAWMSETYVNRSRRRNGKVFGQEGQGSNSQLDEHEKLKKAG